MFVFRDDKERIDFLVKVLDLIASDHYRRKKNPITKSYIESKSITDIVSEYQNFVNSACFALEQIEKYK